MSVARNAAALEAELDACATECIAAADMLGTLPPSDMALLRASLEERFPKRVRRSSSSTTGTKQAAEPRPVLPLVIHDLIESAGQMSQWLLIDDPFEDDEKERDGEQLDDEDRVATFESDCASAGAQALVLVPPGSRRPFSRELLDEYLARLAEFPTVSDVSRAYAKAHAALLSGNDDAFAAAVEMTPLEGINLAASKRLVTNFASTEAMYSSALVRHFKHWAFYLGKYFRLLAQCRDEANNRAHGQVHTPASRASAERASVQRQARVQVEEEARALVRPRSHSPERPATVQTTSSSASPPVPAAPAIAPSTTFASLNASTAPPLMNTSTRAYFGQQQQHSSVATRDFGVQTLAPAAPSMVNAVTSPIPWNTAAAAEEGSPLASKPKKAVHVVRRSTVAHEDGAETEDAVAQPSAKKKAVAAPAHDYSGQFKAQDELEESKALCSQLRLLVTDLTAERNELRRQVQRFSRATGLDVSSAGIVDNSVHSDGGGGGGLDQSHRLQVMDDAIESHRRMVDEYEAQLASAKRDVAESVQTILGLRGDVARAERDTMRAEKQAEDAKRQVLALKQLANSAASPSRIDRLQSQIQRLQEELSSVSQRLIDVEAQRRDEVGAHEGNAQIQRERIAQLTAMLADRDAIIEALQRGMDHAESPPTRAPPKRSAPSRSPHDEEQPDYAPAQNQPAAPQDSRKAGSSWDAGWVSRRSTAEEREAALSERNAKAAEIQRGLKAARPYSARRGGASTSSSRSGSEDTAAAAAPPPPPPAGPALDAIRAVNAGTVVMPTPSVAQQQPLQAQSPNMFRSALRSTPGAKKEPSFAAAPAEQQQPRRIDGLNPLIRHMIAEPRNSVTHVDVSPYADVATDGALEALLGEVRRLQSDSVVQINLINCHRLSDVFARTVLTQAVNELPNLRHVSLDGCDSVSDSTKRGIARILSTRSQFKTVDSAVSDTLKRGATMIQLRGKDLTDDAVCRLVDALLDVLATTVCSVIDLRDNPRLTDDSAVYASQLVEGPGPVTQIMLDGNPLITDSVAYRLISLTAKKRVRAMLGVGGGGAEPRPSTVQQPYANPDEVPSQQQGGGESEGRRLHTRGSLRRSYVDVRASTRGQRLSFEDDGQL